ncbi:TIGR03013 family XrtA/PEP-CTERM system glycosyltransferase [Roseomonas sp. KE2513]|uniref:TIGR03013 family XrtA/PEP-CTERM system glycosyltransferase n=1 Tax=Roseomonas sp. KE2513 TaxID=2479202 RepID=UPI0018DEF3A6|nr:TIGR03013 family XrtA/PEP-CTERM system glycosyltransferase [Roseomonas sp. KE2513]
MDAALIGLACCAVMVLVGRDHPIGVAALAFPAVDLLLLYALGLYRREALVEMGETLGRVPIAAGAGSLVAWAATAALPAPFGSPDAHLLFAAAVPCFAVAGLAARLALHLLRRWGAFRRRLLVVGAGRRAWDLVWMLRREARTLAFEVVFVHDDVMGEVDPRLTADPTNRIVPGLNGLLATARSLNPDQIVVAPDERRGLAMDGLLACKMAGYPVSEYAQFLEREIGRIDLKRLDLGWLLYAGGFVMGTSDRFLKRALDLTVSAALLVFVAPTLIVVALAVKLDDGGPVLYHQDRVSRGGRVFRILKFRTMRTDAERGGAVWAAESDPRITRIGSLLRRTRLDELPQLFNILRGDMAFVGPRPERPEFTRDLSARLPLYNERHLVRAGLTGWAQVNYPYGASLNDARSKLSYDLFYVKNFGILFDLRIILQTLRVIFWPGGVR